jgi:pyruvate/2-oxoglutarate dehydrogenase complex dihydrolipoamide acyltransferase (E2) component
MPILSYFAVVGSVLVALLFVADATLDKSGPLPFNNESIGLPKPWHPEPKSSILTAGLAVEPDMTSAAIRAAAPPASPSAVAAPAAAAVPAPAAKAEPRPQRTAKAEPASKKQKRIARRLPRPDGGRNYAWSRGGYDGGFFGGGSMFGRF